MMIPSVGYKNILPFASRESHYRLQIFARRSSDTSSILSPYGAAKHGVSDAHNRHNRMTMI